MRSTAAKLTTAASITIVLALSGTGTAVAQPGSQFQTQGIRQSEGLRRIPYNTRHATRRAVRRGAVVTEAAVGTGAYYSGTGYSGTGYYGTGYYGTGYSGPASTSLTREQAIRTCVAQAQSQAPGTPLTSDVQRQRGGLYLSCMYSMGQRP